MGYLLVSEHSASVRPTLPSSAFPILQAPSTSASEMHNTPPAVTVVQADSASTTIALVSPESRPKASGLDAFTTVVIEQSSDAGTDNLICNKL